MSDAPAHIPLPTAVRWSHLVLGPRLRDGDIVIDATAGRGYDTHFLAEHVLPHGWVFAFDVQEEAIAATRQRILSLPDAADRVVLHHASHEGFAQYLAPAIRGQVRAFMFNLGFLPGGDKAVITQVDSTLSALRAACDWLADDGVITVTAYPGHEGGREEAVAVEEWMSALSSTEFETQKIAFLNFRPTTPCLMILRKRTPA